MARAVNRLGEPCTPEPETGATATPAEVARLIDGRVARRIRQRRRAIGMTQQQLARLLGVAFQQAHKYERGLSRISAGRLYQLARVLGAPIVYFFALRADPARPEAALEEALPDAADDD